MDETIQKIVERHMRFNKADYSAYPRYETSGGNFGRKLRADSSAYPRCALLCLSKARQYDMQAYFMQQYRVQHATCPI
jgi:hypothetical protein